MLNDILEIRKRCDLFNDAVFDYEYLDDVETLGNIGKMYRPLYSFSRLESACIVGLANPIGTLYDISFYIEYDVLENARYRHVCFTPPMVNELYILSIMIAYENMKKEDIEDGILF